MFVQSQDNADGHNLGLPHLIVYIDNKLNVVIYCIKHDVILDIKQYFNVRHIYCGANIDTSQRILDINHSFSCAEHHEPLTDGTDQNGRSHIEETRHCARTHAQHHGYPENDRDYCSVTCRRFLLLTSNR